MLSCFDEARNLALMKSPTNILSYTSIMNEYDLELCQQTFK